MLVLVTLLWVDLNRPSLRYISDPLCFMGFKFDLRIYVLVTSFAPLEAFIYKEGLARFGTRPYSARPELLGDLRIHLTNTSMYAGDGEGDDVAVDQSHPVYFAGRKGVGNKVALSWLWGRLGGDPLGGGMDTRDLWQKVIDVCRTALEAAGADIPHQPNSFEIFGFDVMFDQRLKCWLIEANSSPSLGCESPLDVSIKGALVRDTIALVDPLAYDRRTLAEVCKRRSTRRKLASNVSSTDVLESDLAQILTKPPRRFGDLPKKMGAYERILPRSEAKEANKVDV